MRGPLIYVMGPSGAGKDAVMERARGLLSIDDPVVFAHRYITRPANAGGENHICLSPGEFDLRRARGLFAFHWQAHGNDYGIGIEINAWRNAGLSVVVSGSREHFQRADGIDESTVPVLITASAARLQERLAKRGREDAAASARRLQRSTLEVAVSNLVTIENDGAIDDAAEALVRLLAMSRRSPAFRRPAESAPAR
ncbi:MAG: phosphonate metabolism protein/1,5-bisphosphokinase (PRPP-forming) PhnN [Alphaproteobacteria bacterium]|nr:phosphonate metabolism protein/1,5-bisphosphokinase (PRPP-forming) PhnN [Alphaproteobacteria bacterium]MBV8408893.1 phosphonate metabolism protein/1,5-bisphosphokinase (PRPP-forming) PhnN [Alphaproteobacteria bacterium]